MRFSLKYYLYNEKTIEQEKAEYLSKVSNQELNWFNENYENKAILVQIVYIRLITEVEKRRANGLHGSNKAVEGLRTAIEKLAKKAKISPEQYFAEKVYPIIATIRNRRFRQCYHFYTGKKLPK